MSDVSPEAVVAAYLAHEPPRERPTFDRLVGELGSSPGLTRHEIADRLDLSYIAVVRLVKRGEAWGWLRGVLRRGGDGVRAQWTYFLTMPSEGMEACGV